MITNIAKKAINTLLKIIKGTKSAVYIGQKGVGGHAWFHLTIVWKSVDHTWMTFT